MHRGCVGPCHLREKELKELKELKESKEEKQVIQEELNEEDEAL